MVKNLYLNWILANFLAWIVVIALLAQFVDGLLLGPLLGLMLAALQVLALEKQINQGKWFAATSLGWILGFALAIGLGVMAASWETPRIAYRIIYSSLWGFCGSGLAAVFQFWTVRHNIHYSVSRIFLLCVSCAIAGALCLSLVQAVQYYTIASILNSDVATNTTNYWMISGYFASGLLYGVMTVFPIGRLIRDSNRQISLPLTAG
jgi:hypothetical protein